MFEAGIKAQEVVTIGTGTNTDYYPIPGFYGVQYSGLLYSSAEINHEGIITQIGFDITSANASTTNRNIRIYLKEVGEHALSTTIYPTWNSIVEGATLVYSADNAGFPNTGWHTFDLTQSFEYSGSGNLLVLVYGYGCATNGGCSIQCKYTTVDGSHWYIRSDSPPINEATATGSTSNLRPNIQLTIDDSNIICKSPKNLAVSNITASSADISWITGGEEEPVNGYEIYWSTSSAIPDDNVEAMVTVSAETNTYSFNNLEELTSYYVWIRYDCGADEGKSSYSFIHFTTAQIPATIPFYCDFDENNYNFILKNGNSSQKWHIGSTTSGTYPVTSGLYISNDNGQSNNYAYLTSSSYSYAIQKINLETNGLFRMQFDWRSNGSSSAYFRAFLVPDNISISENSANSISSTGAPSEWISIDGGTRLYNSNATAWNTSDLEIQIDQAGVYNLVFYWYYGSYNTAYNPPAAIDNISISRITCIRPSSPALSNITANSATLTWQAPITTPAGYQIYLSTSLVEPAANATPTYSVSAPAITQELSGLNAGSLYYVWIRSSCDDDEYSDWIPVYFYTKQNAAAIPYSQDFETGSENTGWVLANGSQTNKWYIGSIQDISHDYGTKGLYISNNNGIANRYDITATSYAYAYRTINFDEATDYNVKFSWRASGQSSNDIVRAFLVPDSVNLAHDEANGMTGSTNTVPANWIAISSALAGQSDWQLFETEITIDGASTPTGNYNLVFFWKNNNSTGTQPPATIDNISVAKIEGCFTPVGITANNISHNSANISWQLLGAATSTNIIFSETAVTDFEAATLTEQYYSGTAYSLENLTPETTYYIYVQAFCGAGYLSEWSEAVSFTTSCAPSILPLSEGFNTSGTSVFPNCWTQQFVTGTSNITFQTSGYDPNTYPNEGTRMVYWNGYNITSGNKTRLVSPTIDVQGISRVSIDFDWRQSSSGGSTSYTSEGVQIQYSVDNGITWINAGDFIRRYASVTEWSPKKIRVENIDEYNQIKIGFLFTSQYGYNCYMDNLNIYDVPSCPAPTNITVSNITPNSADISWTAGEEETEWNIIVSNTQITDFTEITLTESHYSSTTYSASGLNPANINYFYIQAACNSNDSSEWVEYYILLPKALPYSHDFTAGSIENNFWTLANGSQLNKWYIGSTSSGTYSVTDGLYISNNSGASNVYETGTTSYTYAHRQINIPQAGVLNVEFDWRADGENTWDLLRAFLVPENLTSDLTAGNANGMSGSTNTVPTGWISLTSGLLQDQTSVQHVLNEVAVSAAGIYNLVFFWKNDGSSGAQPPAYIDNINMSLISCFKPTNLAVSNITSSSADISWTAGATETEWNIIVSTTQITDFTGITPTAQNLSSAAYPAIGLASYNSYYVYVQAVCGISDLSDWTSAATFTTLCASYSIPFTEDFTATFPPQCWERKELLYTPGAVMNTSSMSSNTHWTSGTTESDPAAYINITGTARKSWLISPAIDLGNTGNLALSFNIKLASGTSGTGAPARGADDKFIVLISVDGGISWDPANAYIWSTDADADFEYASLSQNYQHIYLPLTGITGEVKVAFYGESTITNANDYLFIDNISVDEMSSCPEPASIAISNVVGNSADISWTAGATETEWNIIISTSQITDFAEIVPTAQNLSSAAYPAIGLNGLTTYYVYVQAICGTNDLSDWTRAATFTTLCASYSIPFNEDFTATTFPPSCWERKALLYTPSTVMNTSSMAASTAWGRSVTNSNPGAKMNIYGTARKEWLITPIIDLGNTGNTALSFDVKLTAYNTTNAPQTTGTDDKFIVLVSVDGGISWDPANSYVWSSNADADFEYASLNQNYQYVYLPLTGITGEIKVAFYGESTVGNADNDLFIDNISIVELPSCPKPINIAISNITHNSADISWTAGATETEWNIIVSNTQITDFTGITPTASGYSSTTYPASELNPANSNYFYIQAACGVDDVSEWVEYYILLPKALPYSHDFTAGSIENNFWTLANGTQTNKWHIGSTASGTYSVTDGLYISNNSGESNVYDISTTSYTYAYRQIYIPQAGGLNVEFDWRADGENNWDLLRAFLVPANLTSALTAGNANGIGSNTNTVPTGWISLTSELLQDQTSVQHVLNEVAVTAAGIYNLVFFWKNDSGSGDQPPAYIDNINISLISCFQPNSLTVDNTTDNSADISWDAGLLSEWNIIVSETAITDFTNITPTVSNHNTASYHISELPNGSTRYVYVQGVCENSEYTGWSSTIVNTPCEAISAYPYFEGFNGTNISTCWTVLDVDNNGYMWAIDAEFTYEGTGSARIRWNSSANNNDWLISPKFVISDVDNLIVEFQSMVQSDYFTEDFNVLVSKTGNSPTDFTITLQQVRNFSSTSWQLFLYQLSDYNIQNGDEVYFAIQNISDDQFYQYVDAFRVYVPSNENDILTFSVPNQAGNSVINTQAHTVYAEIGYGESLTALVPVITISDLATISPASGAVQDFTAPVTYTVTSESGEQQQWVVTVVIRDIPSSEKDILTFNFYGMVGDADIDTDSRTVNAQLRFDLDLAEITPSFTLSLYAAATPESGTAQDFTTPFVYTVEAQDESVQDWTVNIIHAAVPVGGNDTNPIVIDFATEMPYSATGQTSCNLGNSVTSECITASESGQEAVYRLDIDAPYYTTFELSATGSQALTYALYEGTIDDGNLILCRATNGSSSTSDIALYAGTYYFVVDINSGNDACLSNYNLSITVDPNACVSVTDLEVESFTQQTAEISWTPGLIETSWDLKYGVFGFDVNTGGTLISGINTNSRSLSGLDINTRYDVYVKPDCLTDWDISTSFRTLSSCPTPVDVVVSNITHDRAEISWNGYNATAWDIIISETVLLDPDTYSTPTNVTAAAYQAQALSAGATYYVYVRANCGSGEYSYYSYQTEFTTLQVPADLPFDSDFEDMNNNNWSFMNGNQENTWHIGSAAGNEESNGLYISNNNGADNSYSTSMTSYVYTFRTLNIETTDMLAVEFDYKVQGETNYDVMNVYLVPQNVQLEAGNANGMTSNTNTAPTGWIRISESNLSGQSSWTRFYNTVEIPSSGLYNLVFFWKNDDGGGTQPPAAIDNIVVRLASSENDILTFEMDEQTGPAVIDETAHTVSLEVEYNVSLTSLIPTITISDLASISPASGVAQDFTNPVTYMVTAENGDEQEWIATVVNAPSPENDILSFSLTEELCEAIIDADNHTILIGVAGETNVTALSPTITISDLASISPESDVPQDFTNPVTYTVTAENGDEQEWTVSVSVINLRCPQNMIVEIGSTTSFTGYSPIGGTFSGAGVSGTSFDATSLTRGNYYVTYTYTDAATGCNQSGTFIVTVVSGENDILSFGINGGTCEATIDATTHTVIIGVENGTDVTALAPNVTVSEYASISPASGVAQDFTNPVSYTITSENGDEQVWTITVYELPAVACPDNTNLTIGTITEFSGYSPEGGVFTGEGLETAISGNTINTTGLSVGRYTVVYTYTHPETNCEISCEFFIDAQSSVISNTVADISIYPNPNSGSFTIEFGNIYGTATYQIIDTKGSVFHEETISVNDSSLEKVSMKLVPGVYYVRITTENQTIVEKVVVL